MNTKNKIFFGKVVATLRHGKDEGAVSFTTVVVEGLDRPLAISDATGPMYISRSPKYGPVFMDKLLPTLPVTTDEVVMEVSDNRGYMEVVAWGYAKFWRISERQIGSRELYRLIYWKGKNSSTELARGTALEINAKFPRGTKDPLLAYRGNISLGEGEGYLYWEQYNANVPDPKQRWAEVGDPRPVLQGILSATLPVAPPAPRVPPASPSQVATKKSVAMPVSLNRRHLSRRVDLADLEAALQAATS